MSLLCTPILKNGRSRLDNTKSGVRRSGEAFNRDSNVVCDAPPISPSLQFPLKCFEPRKCIIRLTSNLCDACLNEFVLNPLLIQIVTCSLFVIQPQESFPGVVGRKSGERF